MVRRSLRATAIRQASAIQARIKSAGDARRSGDAIRGGRLASRPSLGRRRSRWRRLTSTSNAWHDYSRSAAPLNTITASAAVPHRRPGSLFAVPAPTRARGATEALGVGSPTPGTQRSHARSTCNLGAQDWAPNTEAQVPALTRVRGATRLVPKTVRDNRVPALTRARSAPPRSRRREMPMLA